MKWAKRILGALLLIALGVGIRSVVFRRAGFHTAAAEWGRIRQLVTATGRVEADRESVIASKVSGRITEIRVKEGERVDAGQVLVTLDRSELAARRDEALAAYREAARNLDRHRTLFERKSVSRAEYDTVEAATDRAKAALERTESDLRETVLHAPFSGLVTRKYKEVGEVVNTLGAPEPILRLADTEPLKARAEVDESDVGKLALGQEAAVTSDAYPGRILHGRVTQLASQV